ncbi:hypothetical protein SAMD00019534_003510 [Acytostelium subglobosum LB1]|uniref:hypothetical protein n=1 Tax=Acytostelium subglobosum LB1 TaxID=1410327 RepID=UPI0006450CC3|nr:hypothetical protein SAMD00019534_003510 [Acytostelium subglobosum LB1]GAM17176.1 hypothetical protein SAMD00019534_003510 [Acytostelium subglobosum LB1]|eukprot:XP_012759238.1 hypothetical protein SAMD00019534_003510 [Acytostelium subglobosum LB1]
MLGFVKSGEDVESGDCPDTPPKSNIVSLVDLLMVKYFINCLGTKCPPLPPSLPGTSIPSNDLDANSKVCSLVGAEGSEKLSG